MNIENRQRFMRVLKWLAIFLVLFVVFQFIFNLDIFGRQKESNKQAELIQKVEEIEKAYFGISPYWLKRYNISLGNESDVSSDADGDDLTLIDEYQNLTDPFDPDTDKDGYNDGKEVRDGYNPSGEGRIDKNKDGLPDYWEEQNGMTLDQPNARSDQDGDGLENSEEFGHGTDPNEADTDSDGYSDSEEIANGYDPVAPGEARPKAEIIIKKISVTAPIILSKDPNETLLLEELKNGTILYPNTVMPGQAGNSVITGHSSNYVWVKGDFNYVFKDLDSLALGDEYEIKLTQENGRSFNYRYRVIGKEVVDPEDQRIFEQTTTKTSTLVTCWPLNTNLRRLMVKGEIIL